jgi:TRAP-type C4-dicarboxylate transport system substrate-binding protein
MSPAGREALRGVAVTTGAQMRSKARAEVDEAVAAMQKRGLRVVKLTPALEAEWRSFAEGVYPKIRGTLVPAETFDEVTRLLREYRAAGTK